MVALATELERKSEEAGEQRERGREKERERERDSACVCACLCALIPLWQHKSVHSVTLHGLRPHKVNDLVLGFGMSRNFSIMTITVCHR